MIKELVLVPRVLYVALFVWLGSRHAPFGVGAWTFSLVFPFLLSFIWQYHVLHVMLKATPEKQHRLIILIVWMLIASIIIGWSLYLLTKLDYRQELEVLMRQLAWLMSFYLVGTSMFVGGACTRRAYTRHGAL